MLVLVPAAVALGGVLLTQHRADRREVQVWKRTEVERTYDHRRDAYVGYLDAVERTRERAAWHVWASLGSGRIGRGNDAPACQGVAGRGTASPR